MVSHDTIYPHVRKSSIFPWHMRFKRKNDEVLITIDRFAQLDRACIDMLKKKAEQNRRRRIRICIHKNNTDKLQEMFIVHLKDAYIRPHKHLHKSESFHVLEGSVDVILFDDQGNIHKSFRMGNYASGLNFYYKLEEPVYHTMIIHSPYVIFQEVTTGPFRRLETVFAPWSPDESNIEDSATYVHQLKKHIRRIG